ncbi:MAG: hypothetical protein A2481_04025 [Candidatus Yonathbacteria bacterium RIFOXYC2_FULL_47_9]|nr:MAG: hypothetical protein A2481_04025 [Candidatus Yonathbacteria bacterium RIFOXYC2_FULL_47_9]HAT68211.1 hypothetical protein [Candidatus Yonathbacteria bacterium]
MLLSQKRGFTLIELLVVISIIGLLSSVVMSSVNTARKKADNTQRNQIAEEYRKALMLSYDANGGYPYPSAGADGMQYCLGDFATLGNYTEATVCGNMSVATSVNPNSEDSDVLVGPTGTTGVKQFLASLPVMKPTPWAFSGNSYLYKGPMYICTAGVGRCTNATLRWRLEGSSTCIKGALKSNPGDSTFCQLYLD